MSANAIRDDRRYTPDHEWAKLDGDELLIGITAFAVDQLGDITLVSFDAGVGETVDAKQAFGTIESVKTLSDLFAPVSGVITRVNDELEDTPELVNDDCWEKGWMVAIKPSNLAEDWRHLMDADGYQKHLESVDG